MWDLYSYCSYGVYHSGIGKYKHIEQKTNSIISESFLLTSEGCQKELLILNLKLYNTQELGKYFLNIFYSKLILSNLFSPFLISKQIAMELIISDIALKYE